MEINYITTDLELESKENLSRIVDELREELSPHYNDWVKDVYLVALAGGGLETDPENTVAKFCGLLENLSEESKSILGRCSIRVFDIAFESGAEPKSVTYLLPNDLVNRISNLGFSIAITIYPIGSYSPVEINKKT